jgi:hypothetical protein
MPRERCRFNNRNPDSVSDFINFTVNGFPMLDKQRLEQAARTWMEAWNKRDFDTIMAHYADEVEFNSDAVIRRWKVLTGRLTGKPALEKHFRKGLEEVPALHFDFHSILYGPDSILLYYSREDGRLAADVVRFNENAKVIQVTCFLENLL